MITCLVSGIVRYCYDRGVVMGTIMLNHKMGGMLDHDLIEENL